MICTPKVIHFWGAYHFLCLDKRIQGESLFVFESYMT